VIALPALRDRREDLGILVAALLARNPLAASGSNITLSPEVGRALLSYGWPLNVRELQQCLATCVALSEDGLIRIAHLPPSVAAALVAGESSSSPQQSSLNERDQAVLLELLSQLSTHKGNLADVARAMGKARMQIHRWCKRFGIDPNVYRS
jgi:transcriptional regulator of acetoin/glycerol metabolism